MPIFRGTGGSTSTTDQATIDQVTEDAATATTKAAEAASSASNAAASATSAATSATTAATQATNAANSATTSSTQATNAATSATEAAASASSANTSAGIASDSIEFAEEWATKAEDSLISTAAGGDGSTDYSSLHHAAKSAASATAAASSATSAASSATTATTKASEAATSATAAASSASTAASEASDAATSASAASTSASNAATSATNAQAALDSIENFYLGASATAPTVDDNGDPLAAGDWYFNTTDNLTYIYNGSSWQVTVVDTSGLVSTSGDTMTGNLSFGDNDKAIFGAGSDLEIYSNGDSGIIWDKSATGHLILRGSALYLQTQTGENGISINADSDVGLYYDNAIKLSTTSTGIDVTGTVTADGLTVDTDATGITIADASEAENRLEIGVSGGSSAFLKTSISTGSMDLQAGNIFLKNTSGVVLFRADGSTGDISFYEDTGTTAKFFWDASAESLGIGTSSPAHKVDVVGSSAVLRVAESGGSDLRLSVTGSASYVGTYVDDPLVFNTNSTERMRIDSSGNLLVGKTTTGTNIVGIQAQGSGFAGITRDGGTTLVCNRKTSDGEILQFQKDGITVGSIGCAAGRLTIGSGDTALKFDASNDSIMGWNLSTQSNRDNAIDMGYASVRFDDIYATNGTIQTSDEREKQDIDVLSDAEQRVAVAAKGLVRKYRWKDAVAEKGDDARIHFGVIAQDLKAAFEAEGLDAGRYAMFIHSEWWETYTDVPAVEAKDAVLDDDGNVIEEAVEAVDAYTRTDTYDTEAEAPEGAVKKDRMGVRYPELLAFIIGAL